jgi:hypothetical protein
VLCLVVDPLLLEAQRVELILAAECRAVTVAQPWCAMLPLFSVVLFFSLSKALLVSFSFLAHSRVLQRLTTGTLDHRRSQTLLDGRLLCVSLLP